jgi:hypothetical protein
VMARTDPIANLIEDANQHFAKERVNERVAVALERIADAFESLVESQQREMVN